MILVYLANENQMPYLHYEKRCDQARLHKVIVKVSRKVRREQMFRQRSNHTEEDGNILSTNGSVEDNTSIIIIGPEPLNNSKSAPNRHLSQQTQRLPIEDEEQSRFLNAEEALIKGYLHGSERLHVSVLGHFMFLDYQSQRTRLEERLISLTITY